MNSDPRILVTCGEASGDLHASALVAEIRKRIPGATILALGGEKVAHAGARVIFPADRYAVMGFSGVIAKFPRFVRLERALKRVLEEGIDLFIPVDYPGLNLRLAAHATKLDIPVLYYISPQVWAWGEKRIHEMARTIDFMAVILPFEESIYRERGIPVEFVGHPFVADHSLPEPAPQSARSGVGILPGSRVQEVRRIMPILLETARLIHADHPDEPFLVAKSPSVPASVYERFDRRAPFHLEFRGDALEVMANSKLLLSASGTATLQGALLETPLVIVYKLSLVNYCIARRLVKVKNIGLVNILLDEAVCPEFVQSGARPRDICRAAVELLEDGGKREAMVTKFRTLRPLLSGGEGCRRVAEICEQLLNHA